jgi:hypothetical protein
MPIHSKKITPTFKIQRINLGIFNIANIILNMGIKIRAIILQS